MTLPDAQRLHSAGLGRVHASRLRQSGALGMDPDAALKRINDALDHPLAADAADACEDLRAWLDRGGFEPDWEAWPAAAWLYRARGGGARPDEYQALMVTGVSADRALL